MPMISEHSFEFSWIDISTFLGLGGMFFWLFFKKFKENSMIPENDPKLDACLEKRITNNFYSMPVNYMQN